MRKKRFQTTLRIPLAVLFFVQLSSSQEFQFLRKINPFPVSDISGVNYPHPFVGGLNRPVHQFVDIDGDGDLDLFLQDRSDQLAFFVNSGTSTTYQFDWVTDQFEGLQVGAWFKFADPDNDGDMDLFTEKPFGFIRYYRNTGGSSSPDYVLAVDTLRDNIGDLILVDGFSVPEWADIDCDADPDLLLGRLTGRVTHYEHVGLDPGNIPLYEFVSDTFQGLLIVTGGGDQPPKQPQYDTRGLHGANSMTFVDIDGDQDNDLFWGDFFAGSMVYLKNLGSCQVPILDQNTIVEEYPPNNPISTGGFNVPRFGDIDGDSDFDLFVGVLGGAFSLNRDLVDNFYFYENVGNAQQPAFTLQTKRFVNGIDIGDNSIPAFADIDWDGDLDLFIGNEAEPENDHSSRIHFFENQGTSAAPTYRLVASHFLNLEIGFNYAPTFVDIDSDGDKDLFVGEWVGNINFFRNVGTPQSDSLVLADESFGGIDVGNNSTPAFADIDDDQDFDLFIGEFGGNINFYQNIGTPSAPNYQLITSQYFGIDVGEYSYPTFTDIDGDGDMDLFVGSDTSGTFFYRNEGTPQSASFVLDATFQLPHHLRTSPNFVDIDNDIDLDLFSGSHGGGMYFYENQELTSAITQPYDDPLLPSETRLWQNYPNPFNPNTVIRFQLSESGFVTLLVFDLLGREVAKFVNAMRQTGEYSVVFDTGNLPSGIYYYRLKVGTFMETKKMLLLK